ncbi:MAG TPA: hypothetical protein VH989_06045 [Actinomycetota bacterium]
MRRTAFAVVVALMGTLAPTGDVVAAPVPGTTCDVFPADNVWNMDVSGLPVHPKTKRWKKSAHASSTLLHPDFGGDPYGFPFEVTDASTPTTSVSFTYDDESDPGPYPFTAGTPIEQGSDRHALMIDADACVLYELFNARWNGGDPTAGSGAIFDLGSNALRPKTWTSADAAGRPIFPGLVRYDEVQAGSIDHAIRFTVSCTRNRFIWPARHQAGVNDKDCPPMGARFRLKNSFKFAGFSADARVVLKALQRYGMIVADNGSNWYFQGTMDDGWTDDLLDELKSIPASAFQAVDESACKVDPDSAQFQYGPGCPAP